MKLCTTGIGIALSVKNIDEYIIPYRLTSIVNFNVLLFKLKYSNRLYTENNNEPMSN